MPETPNHGYNVPSEGEKDWHEPLNENFEQFETDIEIRDAAGNKGDYEPKAGAKFFAIDTGRTFVGDGSKWQPVPSTGQNPRLRRTTLDDTWPVLKFETGDDALGKLQGKWEDVGGKGWIELNLKDAGPLFSATSEGNFAIGWTLPGVPFDVRGRNNWNLDDGDGDVRIGNGDYRLAMGVALRGGGAGACNIRAKGGTKRLNLGAGTDGHTVQIDPDAVSVNGDLDVSGNKNFTQSVDTDDGEKEVVYTATEAGTPHTEASGFGELEDGRAEITLPEHFGWVTDEAEPLHVQTTPYSADSGGLAVVERSTDRLVVEDLDGEGDYEFSYTVKGTRDGQADKAVVREPAASTDDHDAPAPADD